MSDYIIRPIRLEDAAQTNAHRRRVSDEAYNGTTWSPGEYNRTDDEQRVLIENVLKTQNQMMWVAEADRQVIGLCSCFGQQRISMRHTVGLGIDVNAAWRGKGIGTALMQTAIAWANENPTIRRLELEVFTNNPRAMHIYNKLGFVFEGIRRDAFFKDGAFVDAQLMAIVFKDKDVI